jgi:DNA-binding response OmpR family regulator
MGRILIVDDDPDVLRVVEKVLQVSQHEVYTASDALRAMDLLNASKYDLMISDANMPQFSGFELVRTIKNNKKFENMSIAMLTGLREKKDLEKAIRAGVDDYIVKPIDPLVLLEKVDALFKKKPPMERLQFDLQPGTSYSIGDLATAVQILQLNELGLVLRGKVEVHEGTMVKVGTELFRKLEMKSAPPMKVISCRKIAEGENEIRVAFIGMTEAFHQKVRAWIEQAIKNKRGAA